MKKKRIPRKTKKRLRRTLVGSFYYDLVTKERVKKILMDIFTPKELPLEFLTDEFLGNLLECNNEYNWKLNDSTSKNQDIQPNN